MEDESVADNFQSGRGARFLVRVENFFSCDDTFTKGTNLYLRQPIVAVEAMDICIPSLRNL